jgi:hypothetical protein
LWKILRRNRTRIPLRRLGYLRSEAHLRLLRAGLLRAGLNLSLQWGYNNLEAQSSGRIIRHHSNRTVPIINGLKTRRAGVITFG